MMQALTYFISEYKELTKHKEGNIGLRKKSKALNIVIYL